MHHSYTTVYHSYTTVHLLPCSYRATLVAPLASSPWNPPTQASAPTVCPWTIPVAIVNLITPSAHLLLTPSARLVIYALSPLVIYALSPLVILRSTYNHYYNLICLFSINITSCLFHLSLLTHHLSGLVHVRHSGTNWWCLRGGTSRLHLIGSLMQRY